MPHRSFLPPLIPCTASSVTSFRWIRVKDRAQPRRYRKVDERAEAHLIALACSPAPEGHEHWELRLLADRMVELGVVESLSHEAVRLHLKKTPLNRGRRKNGASPR